MKLLSRLALATLLALPLAAQAQGYPNKPIKMIIPLAAGSAVDNAARVVTQKMGETLGQGFAVENIAGAAGVTGAERLARSTPDGYTIGGFNDSVLTMVPHLVPKMPWNALTDFVPVSLVGTIEWGLVVKAESPYRTLADFLAAAKAAPGKLNYGSGGNGSPQHIGMALIMDRAQIDVVHVPYKGATPAAVAVAAGEVDVSMQGLGTVTSLIQGGKLRLLAVSTPQRLAQYPNVPTFQESGMPNFTFNSWFAMVAPAGTPPEIVQRLNDAVRTAVNDPATREKLIGIGVTPRGTTAAEFGTATKAQYELYRKVIQDKGISAN
ncbi:MAG: Bug family tripartite tricarboxylate transporter substrate binding protein [Hydrogenophaga sp.]|jgi:tripartite-type tricarboxylate transporter receptor subunit TctC|uniref:Bug family tripartite tricarboxylate transporter substrate binding protein n=1 Tax=Hydrogenophaga sp. TaxID=1904254 RepID=UPI001D5D6FB9|nr:tripartite tricarboxylate transporter substrate binding protein [Hydrogenophaga sp.]MBW0171841.1 tripartite tricarboxylate transporter substrate binding protein [Hydrogenophaga sp.]MBW0184838.1 tripartite tricarboxylate transporter substrate binding protein [Hydrogenophaga sp.]